MYNIDSVKIPEHQLDDLDDILTKDGKKAFSPANDFLWVNQDEELFKRAVRAYMASSTFADECVGVVLDALRKSSYADNTIVILFGDHGWHLGEKLRFRKATLDLYPTLIDLCDLPKKENLDGESIVPLLKNPEKKWHPTVTSRGKGGHSVIDENWHYINWGNGVEELYCLENDPMEWNNLIQKQDNKAQNALNYLKKYLPENDADEIAKSKKDKSIKFLDTTIKDKRKETIIK